MQYSSRMLLSNDVSWSGIVYTTTLLFLIKCSLPVVHAFSRSVRQLDQRSSYATFAPMHAKYAVKENVTLAFNTSPNNLTKEEIRNLLIINGFEVIDNENHWPMAIFGDIIYSPEDVIPEMRNIHQHRGANLIDERLWLDKNDNAEVWYYVAKNTNISAEVVDNSMKGWADNTCITFTKLEPNRCGIDFGHGALCFDDGPTCASIVGNYYSRIGVSQEVHLPQLCSTYAATHEMAHALGMMHEQSRSDSKDIMHIKVENFLIVEYNEMATMRRLQQVGVCNPDQVIQSPKPFDPRSLVMYPSNEMSGSERNTFVPKDIHLQYLQDYRQYERQTLLMQSHFDYYIINMGYKCPSKLTKRCEENGKTAPKCKNYGYLTKKCVCRCGPGFSGSTCSTKTGPMYPLLKKALMFDINEPGMLDLRGKMIDEKQESPCLECHFITIVIRTDDDHRISVYVGHLFHKVAKVYTKTQSFIADTLRNDCYLRAHIGEFMTGNIRCECLSTLSNNEFAENRPLLRSKNKSLDIYIMTYKPVSPDGSAQVAREAIEYQLDISFLERPEVAMEVSQINPGEFAIALNRFGKAMKKTIRRYTVVLVLIPIFMMLFIAVALGVSLWKKKRDLLNAKEQCSKSSVSNESGSFSEKSSATDDTKKQNLEKGSPSKIEEPDKDKVDKKHMEKTDD